MNKKILLDQKLERIDKSIADLKIRKLCVNLEGMKDELIDNPENMNLEFIGDMRFHFNKLIEATFKFENTYGEVDDASKYWSNTTTIIKLLDEIEEKLKKNQ